ncbi:hypothetical protein BDF20DRAFT_919792 [Mycotypha africana]|uniref:uncharacterized protein n=1 Tax=Mycotypha africana TaxID=64632 RepID=UPI0022FFF108|nr:uncharacterized protein BDF20DRAFT_919792 [Mycotypha africana]KAI8991314.1 hypothetical protein BDF20DRAFT_919792 [Mycotypha africana]
MSNIDTLLEFYGSSGAKDRFTLYQGKQRVIQPMVNMLTHGASKYDRSRRNRIMRKKKRRKKWKKNTRKKKEHDILTEKKRKQSPFVQPMDKVPLVVFGAGMFGKDNVKLKGLRCGVVGRLFKALKRREAEGGLII